MPRFKASARCLLIALVAALFFTPFVVSIAQSKNISNAETVVRREGLPIFGGGGATSSNTASDSSSSGGTSKTDDLGHILDTIEHSYSFIYSLIYAGILEQRLSKPQLLLGAHFFFSALVSTNAQGQGVTQVVTQYVPNPSSSPSPSSGADTSGNSSSSGGVSTSTIIGLSVAGGIGLIGFVAFIIWKFSRKRFGDEFDDSEAIKWPELNTHGENPHALPTQRTGGSGFDTSSSVNLMRHDSHGAASVANSAAGVSASAVDLYASNDPYAVPPLPHLNPNVGAPGAGLAQPYRDDPGAGYYDPYSGPVPHTLDGEAIPMTQIGARARSPMPGAVPDARLSPAPQAAYPYADPRMSPAPPPGLGGVPRTMSPAPMAYGGRASPGPHMAYGAGAGGYGA
ncbi:hypothetical protein B0H21DRAFT_709469 [Amylocystis lapponica]|nr:hypothetical protein B0H21DRAFT_709469 [Amylocystis lapponica]